MTTAEARNLKRGDPVITFNGPYQQNGTVEAVEPHHRSGYWIRYYWRNPKGQTLEGRKRHTSVYLPNTSVYLPNADISHAGADATK